MIRITENDMNKLYRKWLIKNVGLGIVIGGLMCWAMITADFGIAMILLLTTIFMLFAFCMPPGSGFNVANTFLQLREDHLSEKTVIRLKGLTVKSKNFADKIIITLILCDVYRFRGEIEKALELIDSIDRTALVRYPAVGMNFYNCIMNLYDAVGDTDSVLAAYRDGEAFIDECALRNINCCCTAAESIIIARKAMGDYREAVEMQLSLNKFNPPARQTSEMGSIVSGTNAKYPFLTGANVYQNAYADFLTGLQLYRTAELAMLIGDAPRAAGYIDKAGPVISQSSFYLNKANALSERIRSTLG